MSVEHFNQKLRELRESRKFTIKQLSKAINVSAFKLKLIEKGYIKPSDSLLKALSEFYGENLSDLNKGESSYPVPLTDLAFERKESRFKAAIIKKSTKIWMSVLVGVGMVMTAAGSLMFADASKHADAHFGESYTSVKRTVVEHGSRSTDVLSLTNIYTIFSKSSTKMVTIDFYETPTIMFADRMVVTYHDGEGRYTYQYGGGLTSGYGCIFTFSPNESPLLVSFTFDANEEGKVKNIVNPHVANDFDGVVDEAYMFVIGSKHALDSQNDLTQVMSMAVGKQLDFMKDFMAHREVGRIKNLALHVFAFINLFLGLVMAFVFFGLDVYAFSLSTRARWEMVDVGISRDSVKRKPLPTDWDQGFFLPEVFFTVISVLLIGVFALRFLGASTGFMPPSIANADWFVQLANSCLYGAVFIIHFLSIEYLSREKAILSAVILAFLRYVFIGSLLTVVNLMATMWKLDAVIKALSFLPENFLGVLAWHYLIVFFLFYKPVSLKNKPRMKTVWRILSVLPLFFLIGSYIVGTLPNTVYGIDKSPYLKYWFPSKTLPLSIACVVYMVAWFVAHRVAVEKYGIEKADTYFNGQRYQTAKNIIAASLFFTIGLFELVFRNHTALSYLGFGGYTWMMALAPLLLLYRPALGQQESKRQSAIIFVLNIMLIALLLFV